MEPIIVHYSDADLIDKLTRIKFEHPIVIALDDYRELPPIRWPRVLDPKTTQPRITNNEPWRSKGKRRMRIK